MGNKINRELVENTKNKKSRCERIITIFISILLIGISLLYLFGPYKIIIYKIGDIESNNPIESNNYDFGNIEKQKNIILPSLKKFNFGVKQKTFSLLYKDFSIIFKKQHSLEVFDKKFGIFFTENIKFDNLESIDNLVLTKDTFIDKDGLLTFEGIFIENFKFKLKYNYEDGIWKLININIQELIYE